MRRRWQLKIQQPLRRLLNFHLHDEFEFPENGSLSESKIKDLEEKLNEKRRKFEKRTIKRETYILIEDMQRVLQMWKEEAENRRQER